MEPNLLKEETMGTSGKRGIVGKKIVGKKGWDLKSQRGKKGKEVFLRGSNQP